MKRWKQTAIPIFGWNCLNFTGAGQTVSDRFIDKSRLDINRTTNATGVVTAVTALMGAYEAATSGVPIKVWGPMTIGGLLSAFAQWLQGSPSAETKAIAKAIGLNNRGNNRDLISSIVDRAVSISNHDNGLTGQSNRYLADDRRVNNGQIESDPAIAAWEEAHRLRRQYGAPQIPSHELEDWQAFNAQADEVQSTQGW